MADAVIDLIANDMMSKPADAAAASITKLDAAMTGVAKNSQENSQALAANTSALNGLTKAADEGGLSLADFASAAKIAGAAALVLVGSVVALEERFVATTLATANMAAMAGTTVESFSELSGAAEHFGASGEGVQQALTMMEFRMKAALDSGSSLGGALGGLGVTVQDFTATADGSSAVLLKLADIFASMPDGAQKTALAMEVFGRSGAQMIPLLDKGSEALRTQMDHWRALGLATTDADVQMSRGIKSAQNDLMEFASAGVDALARALGPTFESVLRSMGATADEIMHTVVDQFGGIGGATKKLTEDIHALEGPLTWLAVTGLKAVAWTAAATAEGLGLAAAAALQTAIAMRSLEMAVASHPEKIAPQIAALKASRDAMLDFSAQAQHTANSLVGITTATVGHTEATGANTAAVVVGSEAHGAHTATTVAATAATAVSTNATSENTGATTANAAAQKDGAAATKAQSAALFDASGAMSAHAVATESARVAARQFSDAQAALTGEIVKNTNSLASFDILKPLMMQAGLLKANLADKQAELNLEVQLAHLKEDENRVDAETGQSAAFAVAIHKEDLQAQVANMQIKEKIAYMEAERVKVDKETGESLAFNNEIEHQNLTLKEANLKTESEIAYLEAQKVKTVSEIKTLEDGTIQIKVRNAAWDNEISKANLDLRKSALEVEGRIAVLKSQENTVNQATGEVEHFALNTKKALLDLEEQNLHIEEQIAVLQAEKSGDWELAIRKAELESLKQIYETKKQIAVLESSKDDGYIVEKWQQELNTKKNILQINQETALLNDQWNTSSGITLTHLTAEAEVARDLAKVRQDDTHEEDVKNAKLAMGYDWLVQQDRAAHNLNASFADCANTASDITTALANMFHVEASGANIGKGQAIGISADEWMKVMGTPYPTSFNESGLKAVSDKQMNDALTQQYQDRARQQAEDAGRKAAGSASASSLGYDPTDPASIAAWKSSHDPLTGAKFTPDQQQLAEKQKQLDDLKNPQSGIAAQIKQIEDEIAQAQSAAKKADPVGDANRALSDARINLANQEATREQQIQQGLVASKKQLFDAEIQFETQRRLSSEDEARKDALSTQSAILTATQKRYNLEVNAALNATHAKVEAELALDQARANLANNELTRQETVQGTILSLKEQILNNDINAEAIEKENSDSMLIRLEAEKDVRLEIAQAKHQELINEAKALDYAKMGVDPATKLAANMASSAASALTLAKGTADAAHALNASSAASAGIAHSLKTAGADAGGSISAGAAGAAPVSFGGGILSITGPGTHFSDMDAAALPQAHDNLGGNGQYYSSGGFNFSPSAVSHSGYDVMSGLGFHSAGGGYLGFASGTGLAGVPGSGSGDSVPAMLTPGEIVLNPAQSNAMRAAAAGGGAGGAGGGGVSRLHPDDIAALAAAVAEAVSNISIQMDSRELARGLYDTTRRGHVSNYGPAGTTTSK